MKLKNKYKSKLRNLILGTISGFTLIGCDSNIGTGDNTPANRNNTSLSSSTMENVTNEVWFSVPQTDWNYHDGRVSFMVENNSNSSFSLVGCAGDFNYDSVNVNTAPNSKLIVQNTNYAPIQDQPSSFSILTGQSASHGSGYCYYNIHLNDIDQDMYIKLNLNREDYSTQEALFQDVNIPGKDAAYLRDRITSGMVNIIGPLAGYMTYKALEQASQDLVKAANRAAIIKYFVETGKLQDTYTSGTMDEINRIKNLPEDQQTVAWDEFYENIRTDTQVQNAIYFRKDVPKEDTINYLKQVDHFEARAAADDERLFTLPIDKTGNVVGPVRGFVDGRSAWIEANSAITQSLMNPNSRVNKTIDVLIDMMEKDPSLTLDKAINDSLMALTNEFSDRGLIALDYIQDYKFAKILLMYKDPAAPINAVPEYLKAAMDENVLARATTGFRGEAMGNAIDTAALHGVEGAVVKRSALELAMASTGVGLAIDAITWFGVQPMIDAVFNTNNVIGSFATGLTHGYISVPTATEIADWNSAHPDKPMVDSTNYLNSVVSTINNQLLISPKNVNGEQFDQSVSVIVSLDPLSTPFVRPTKVFESGSYHDPYDRSITEENDGNSVIKLSINSIGQTNLQNQDFMNETVSNLFTQAGYGGDLATLNPAPVINNVQTQPYNGSTSTALLKAQKNLLKVGTKLTSVSNIQGVFVQPDQLVTLGLTIPTLFQSTGESTNEYGNGYSVEYVQNYTGESPTIVSYPIVKNTKIFDQKKKDGAHSLLAITDKPMPYKLNDNVNLTIGISGNSGISSSGNLYIADAYGRATSVPIYLNYALLAEPQSISGQTNGDSIQFTIANVSSSNYNSLEISGLPPGATVSSDALNTLNAGSQRVISVDMSNVDQIGNYVIIIKGKNSGTPKANDIQKVKLTIMPSW